MVRFLPMSLQGQGNFSRSNDSAAGDHHVGDYANISSLSRIYVTAFFLFCSLAFDFDCE